MQVRHVNSGPGRMLVAIYGLFALAATGRSVMQIAEYFHKAPVPYLLSALAAVVYLVATVALARGDRTSVRLARATISFELFGVLAVGLWSLLDASAFRDKTVWSHFGQGYGFVPLMLPIIGLWWLHRDAVMEREGVLPVEAQGAEQRPVPGDPQETAEETSGPAKTPR